MLIECRFLFPYCYNFFYAAFEPILISVHNDSYCKSSFSFISLEKCAEKSVLPRVKESESDHFVLLCSPLVSGFLSTFLSSLVVFFFPSLFHFFFFLDVDLLVSVINHHLGDCFFLGDADGVQSC